MVFGVRKKVVRGWLSPSALKLVPLGKLMEKNRMVPGSLLASLQKPQTQKAKVLQPHKEMGTPDHVSSFDSPQISSRESLTA